MSEGLWTIAELKHYIRTGEEPGAQPAGEKKPKATRRTGPKRPAKTPEAPLSVEAAWQISKVKAALARDAKVSADVALQVYEKLSAGAERKGCRDE